MKNISIITNKKVDITFEGEECLLKRTIISTLKEKNYKKYIILTERCNFYDTQVIKINKSTGLEKLDSNGEPILEAISKLVTINKKDKEAVVKYSFSEIDNLYNIIKKNIPDNFTKMDTENLEEQLALLVITQQEEPWNTQASDWEILN